MSVGEGPWDAGQQCVVTFVPVAWASTPQPKLGEIVTMARSWAPGFNFIGGEKFGMHDVWQAIADYTMLDCGETVYMHYPCKWLRPLEDPDADAGLDIVEPTDEDIRRLIEIFEVAK